MSDPGDHEIDGAWECPDCGAVLPDGPNEVEVEDENLWGVVGQTYTQCPECGATPDLL